MTFHPDTLPDLSGKVYIVTGGTGGIGFCTVSRLAQHGAHVYLCARSQTKGETAVEEVRTQHRNAKLSVLVMDHNSLSSVVLAAKDFLSKETSLHGLINNAGVMAIPYEITEDGHEAQWQTNYLAHWVFAHHLLPCMLNTSKGLPSGSVRYVELTSGGHMTAPKPGIKFEDLGLKDHASIDRYGQSKLANILHAKTLHRLYGPGSPSAKAGKGEIWSTAVHPGVVFTDLNSKALEMPLFMRIVTPILNVVGYTISADKGSWTSLYCVASSGMTKEQSGLLFEPIAKPAGMLQSAKAKDMNLAEKLETWTQKEMEKGGYLI